MKVKKRSLLIAVLIILLIVSITSIGASEINDENTGNNINTVSEDNDYILSDNQSYNVDSDIYDADSSLNSQYYGNASENIGEISSVKSSDSNSIIKEDNSVLKEGSDKIYVSKSGDDNNDGTVDSPVSSIEKAIELVSSLNNKDIIILDGNYLLSNQTIKDKISFTGVDNVVISPSEDSKIFTIDGGSLTLKNIKFTNARLNNPSRRTYGTIIVVKDSSANLLVDNCSFENNYISGAGSVIGASASTVNFTILNSRFMSNIADGTFGVICIDRRDSNGNLTIDNCSFINNSANNTAVIYSRSCDVKITNSVFTNNTAIDYTGIIQIYNSTNGKMDNCRFYNNTCLSTSTGDTNWIISLESPSTNINSNFIINKTAVLDNVMKNTTKDYLIYINAVNVTVENSALLNNNGVSNKTVYVKGTSSQTEDLDNGTVITKNVYGSLNSRNTWWGSNLNPSGLIDVENYNNIVELDNWVIMKVNFIKPDNIKIGDIINLNVSFNNVMDKNNITEFYNNTIPYEFKVKFDAIGGEFENGIVIPSNGIAVNKYTANDEKIHNITVSVDNEIQEYSLDRNSYFGVIYVSKSGNDENDGSVRSPVLTVAKAIELASINGSAGKIIIADGVYTSNSLDIDSDLEINGSSNTVIDGGLNGYIFLINPGHTVSFNNLKLVNGSSNFGSVIKNYHSISYLNNITVVNNIISLGYGVSMSALYNTGNMTINNSYIGNNSGYGLLYNGGNLSIINSVISSNNAVNGSYGLIYDDSKNDLLNIVNSSFENNRAKQGIFYVSSTSPGNLKIYDSNFISNKMEIGFGGAVNNQGKNLLVNNSKFIDNVAVRMAGAIYTFSDSIIENSTFINNVINTTDYNGSAIAVGGGNSEIHYNVFLSNDTHYALLYNMGQYSNVNAQYNWWGTNDDPISNGLVESRYEIDEEHDETIDCPLPDVSKWVILNVTLSPDDEFKADSPVIVEANFNHYFDNSTKTIKDLNNVIPNGLKVDFTSENGEFTTPTVFTENGKASSVYKPIEGENNLNVSSSNTVISISLIAEDASEDTVIDLYNSTFFNYFDENGRLKGDVVPEGAILNFHGDFANLVSNGKKIDLVSFGKKVKLNGIDARIYNISFFIDSDYISLKNMTFIDSVQGTAVYLMANNTNIINVSINETKLQGFAYGISISGNVHNIKLINNTIDFNAQDTENSITFPVYIEDASNILIENNAIRGNMTSRSLNFNPSLEVLSGNIALINVNGSTLKSNNFDLVYNNVSGSFDTLYNVLIRGCSDLKILNNKIKTIGNSYAYGINVFANTISENLTYPSNNFLIDNNTVVTTAKYYSNGINLNGPATGIVSNNNINATADNVSYIIISSSYDGLLYVNYTNNNIYGLANSVYGMQVLGTSEQIIGNTIIADGNFTLGISTYDVSRELIIRNNTLILRGTGLGKPTLGDHINSTNLGIYIENYPAVIEGNNITSTGYYGINITNTSSRVVNNYIMANSTYGDDAVYYTGSRAVVLNNTPARPVYSGIVYVSKNGSDKNNGSEESPLSTVKKAIEIASKEGASGHIIIKEGIYNEHGLDIDVPLIIEGSGMDKTVINGTLSNYIIKNLFTDLTLINLTLTNGKNSVESGGALCLIGNTTLNGVRVSDSLSYSGDYYYGNGGGIYAVGNLKIYNSEFINNKAIKSGGAIYMDQDTSGSLGDKSSIVIINSTFKNNTGDSSTYGGGAIRMQRVDGVKFIENTDFTNNSAPYGGAISYAQCENEFDIINSSFINNTALSTDATYYGGSAISARSLYSEKTGPLNIYNSIFRDNKNNGDGGAVFLSNVNANINYSVFVNNTDSDNISIYNYKYEAFDAGKVNINYNWWGMNNPVKTMVSASNDKWGLNNIQFNNWVIAEIFASKLNEIPINAPINISVKLTRYNSTNGTVGNLNSTLYENALVKFIGNGVKIAENGTINNGITTVEAVLKDSKWNITGFLDNQDLFINGTGIIQKDSYLTINSSDIDYGENATVDVIVNNGNCTGNITVFIDNVEFSNFTLSDGKFTFTISNLSTGDKKITVKYNGDLYNFGCENSTTITVKHLGSTMNVDYDLDSDNNLIINIKINPVMATGYVNVNVNEQSYRSRLNNCSAKLVIPKLENGVYKILVSYDGDTIYRANNYSFDVVINNIHEKINTTIDSHDFSQTAVDFYNGERGGLFVVALRDANGNPLIGKKVKIGFNGAVYNRTTDENGSAQLQINLRTAGDYTFATAFLGDDDYAGSFVVNTIHISKKVSRIVLSGNSPVKVNAYRTLTISLQGQRALNHNSYITAANKTVKVTVNGRTYSVRIGPNKKGTLRVRFTRAGTYTITTKFAGDGTYSAKTLTSKITVRK